MPTSISDLVDGYSDFAARASSDAASFARFRRNPVGRRVIETLNGRVGREIVRKLPLHDPAFRDFLKEAKRNDSVGLPLTWLYWWPWVGRFSPTTLRYVHVAYRLQEQLGSLDGKRIAEIGVGYGGQARILHAMHPGLAEYALYDLPPVLELAKRYLGNFAPMPLKLISTFAVEPATYDLVISNYAFSELHSDVQLAYIDKVISRSAHGFMLYNVIITATGIPSLTIEETAGRLADKRPQILVGTTETDRRKDVLLLRW